MFYLGAVFLAIANVCLRSTWSLYLFQSWQEEYFSFKGAGWKHIYFLPKLRERVVAARRFSLAIPFPLRISEKQHSLQFTVLAPIQ